MNAAELGHRHLPTLEAGAVESHLQIADHQSFIQNFLLGKTGSVDRAEANEVSLALLQVVVDSFLGEIVQFVVPSLVSENRGEDRAGAEGVLPALGQQVVQGFSAAFEIGLGRRENT